MSLQRHPELSEHARWRVKCDSRGYSTAINKTTNPQLAELQTSKQQIDHQLIDQLLICRWKLMN